MRSVYDRELQPFEKILRTQEAYRRAIGVKLVEKPTYERYIAGPLERYDRRRNAPQRIVLPDNPYTGDFMDGQEAERYGLLNKLVPHDQLEEATQELAAKIAKGPPIALRLGKLMMVRGLELGFETSLEMAAIANVIPQLSEDANEGRRSFEEKRDPNFRGR